MKTTGIIIFAIDLLKTLYTSFNNAAKEKSAESEEFMKIKEHHETANWKSYAGIGMMVIGGALLVLGSEKSPSEVKMQQKWADQDS
jgi:hypothetical protein